MSTGPGIPSAAPERSAADSSPPETTAAENAAAEGAAGAAGATGAPGAATEGAAGAGAEGAASSAAPVPRRKGRGRLIAFLIAVALVAAAYGVGRLQGALSEKAAREEWQKQKAEMESSAAANQKELSDLRSQKVLWRMESGLSEVLANVADKNYGLARDGAQELSDRLSGALQDMDPPLRGRVRPLAPMLDDAARAADSLSPDTRAKVRAARDLVRQILLGPAPPATDGSGGGGAPTPPARSGAAGPGATGT